MSQSKILIILLTFAASIITIPDKAYSLAVSEGHFGVTVEWDNPLVSDHALELDWHASASGYGESDWDYVGIEKWGEFTAQQDGTIQFEMVFNLDYYLMIQNGDQEQHSIFSVDEHFHIINQSTGGFLFDNELFGVDGEGISGIASDEETGGEVLTQTYSVDCMAGDVLSWYHAIYASGSVDNWTKQPLSVPEPLSALLLGTCLIGLAGFRKKFNAN